MSAIKDIKRIRKKLGKYKAELLQLSKKTLEDTGLEMVRDARRNHRFENQSLNANNSITRTIEGSVQAGYYRLLFFADSTRTTTKSDYNYFWGLHDGTGKGYKTSKLTPKVVPKLKSKGYKHDHFMVDAWDENIPKLKSRIKKNNKEAIKKAGLK
jgi:hypothetical protein